MLSGFPTDRFTFEGFLPRRGPIRRERIAALVTEPRTAVLFEAPNRIVATLTALLAACGPLREVAVARELTKLYETVWRGTLDDAVEHVTAVEPRGEHVIVLAPAPEPPEANDEEVDAHVTAALGEGLSTRDAAARVAKDLRVPAVAPTTPPCASSTDPPKAEPASQNRAYRTSERRRFGNRVGG